MVVGVSVVVVNVVMVSMVVLMSVVVLVSMVVMVYACSNRPRVDPLREHVVLSHAKPQLLHITLGVWGFNFRSVTDNFTIHHQIRRATNACSAHMYIITLIATAHAYHHAYCHCTCISSRLLPLHMHIITLIANAHAYHHAYCHCTNPLHLRSDDGDHAGAHALSGALPGEFGRH
jgi:hypothetical protein